MTNSKLLYLLALSFIYSRKKLFVCCVASIQLPKFTSFSCNKTLQKKMRREENILDKPKTSICLAVWLVYASAVPEISFVKSCKQQRNAGWQAESCQDIIVLFLGATRWLPPLQIQPPGPARLSALALCLFLQRALDEGQFVWMFNAAALAGGGLYEMDQWFVAAGKGLE